MTRYPAFNEVRTIPGRKNIAFVEYADENASSTARDALHNTKIQDMKLKVCSSLLSLRVGLMSSFIHRLPLQRSESGRFSRRDRDVSPTQGMPMYF